MIIFKKDYDCNSIVDLGRDISEMWDYNSDVESIPVDEHGMFLGTVKVTVEWDYRK